MIDAGCRDVRDLTAMGFPGLVAGDLGAGDGEGNARVSQCADRLCGAAIEAGDVMVADDDGVVVVRAAEAAEVLARAEARLALEEAKRQQAGGG